MVEPVNNVSFTDFNAMVKDLEIYTVIGNIGNGIYSHVLAAIDKSD